MNSSELKGFLTGLIYGDGYIDGGTTKRSFKIKNIDKNFIQKIEEELKSCTNFTITVKNFPFRIGKDGTHHKEYWELSIKAHPYFAKKYHHFYDDYKHRIASKESLKWLTPMGLAYWYMSDGYICLVGKTKGFIRDRRIDICTDRYSIETINQMRNMLLNRFNLKTSLIKRGKFYRIRIIRESYLDFYNLVFPYLIPSMQYKLYFGYNTKPEWMTEEMWNIQSELKSAIALPDKAEG